MRIQPSVVLLAAAIAFSLCHAPLISQNAGDGSETEGFGLQADIFRNVRDVKTDFSMNFSSLRDYQLTPGDKFTVTVSPGILDTGSGQATGRTITYAVQLQEDFTLDVPILGVVNVRGMSLPDVQTKIGAELKRAMTAQYANFILSAPAQFNVFIYGGVVRPGEIVATPLVTLIDAIAMASGFKPGASYRAIELRREGSVKKIDISRYYENADFTANPRLRPGDTIYVPAAEIVSVVDGNAKYPGTYELIPGDTLRTLLALAGGPLVGTDLDAIEIRRLDANGIRYTQNVLYDEAADFQIHDGDLVTLRAGIENPATVTIEGAVFGRRIPGNTPVTVPTDPVRIDFPYFPGIRVLDLLDGSGGPTPYAIADAARIVKHSTDERIVIDLDAVWGERNQDRNSTLDPGDVVLIPMQKLNIFVSGSVNTPGAVSYIRGYTVADYLLLAGGLVENTANPKALFELGADGKRLRTDLESEPAPGTVLYVGKRTLFQADQQMQNLFVATGWVVTIATLLTTIWEFLALAGII